MKSEDRLPKLICANCTEQLKGAYTFKQQCQQTDVSLREYVKNFKSDDVKTELENTDEGGETHVLLKINQTNKYENKKLFANALNTIKKKHSS